MQSELTIVTHADNGNEVVIKGKIGPVRIDVERDYEAVDSLWNQQLYFKNNTYTLSATLIPDEQGIAYTQTVKGKSTETVKRTARAKVKAATTKRLEQARNKVGAPEDAAFACAPSGDSELPFFVTFTWEEKV